MKLMNTVNATFELCRKENIGISRNAIRQLAKQGKIPCVMVGNKILINYEGLIDFLNSSRLNPDIPSNTGVRPIKISQ